MKYKRIAFPLAILALQFLIGCQEVPSEEAVEDIAIEGTSVADLSAQTESTIEPTSTEIIDTEPTPTLPAATPTTPKPIDEIEELSPIVGDVASECVLHRSKTERLAWDPTGRYIAYSPVWLENIYLFDLQVTEEENQPKAVKLVDDGMEATDIDWSTDGEEIVFTSNVDGDYDLYIVNIETKETRRLTNKPGDEFAPYWSPTGDLISYTWAPEGFVDNIHNHSFDAYPVKTVPLDIYTISPTGDSDSPIITTSPREFGFGWSPDGQKILFTSDEDGSVDVYQTDLSGNQIEMLTDFETGCIIDPEWSFNGEYISYVWGEFEDAHHYLMNIDSRDAFEIAAVYDPRGEPFFQFYPDWSPIKNEIILGTPLLAPTVVNMESSTELFIVTTDGYYQTQLTFTDETSEWGQAWSPDGQRIAFLSGYADNPLFNLEIFNLETSERIFICELSTCLQSSE